MAKVSSLSFVKEAFNKYCAHATLNYKPKDAVEGVADKCCRWFWGLLTEEEQRELNKARAAALRGTTIKEFNDVTGKIKNRLFN